MGSAVEQRVPLSSGVFQWLITVYHQHRIICLVLMSQTWKWHVSSRWWLVTEQLLIRHSEFDYLFICSFCFSHVCCGLNSEIREAQTRCWRVEGNHWRVRAPVICCRRAVRWCWWCKHVNKKLMSIFIHHMCTSVPAVSFSSNSQIIQ